MGEPIDLRQYKNRDWHDRVEGYARIFSDAMKKAFIENRGLARSSRNEFKLNQEEQIEFQLYEVNVFFDYLVATAVSIISFYSNDSEQVEEAVIGQVRQKFKLIREDRKLKEQGRPNDQP